MTELDLEPIHTPALDLLEREFARLGAAAEQTPARRPARRRWVLPAAATSAVGAAVVLAATLLSLGSVRPTTASALARAADAAAQQPDADLLGPGQSWYTRTQSADGQTTFEAWRDADGRARLRSVPADEANGQERTTTTSGGFALGLFDYDELLALPTEPAALLARIGEAIERDPAWSGGDPAANAPLGSSQFVAIGLLLDAPGSPQLRAALFRAAALIPGVEYLGDVTDPRGRAGEAVAYDAPNPPVQGGSTPTTLTYDPATGELLSLRAGAATFVQLAADPVDAMGALPAGLAPLGRR